MTLSRLDQPPRAAAGAQASPVDSADTAHSRPIFPAELLLIIVRELGVQDSQGTLLNLMKASRMAYDVAMPELYRSVNSTALDMVFRGVLTDRDRFQHTTTLTLDRYYELESLDPEGTLVPNIQCLVITPRFLLEQWEARIAAEEAYGDDDSAISRRMDEYLGQRGRGCRFWFSPVGCPLWLQPQHVSATVPEETSPERSDRMSRAIGFTVSLGHLKVLLQHWISDTWDPVTAVIHSRAVTLEMKSKTHWSQRL